MTLFRAGGWLRLDEDAPDRAREGGYTQRSEFCFPDLYLVGALVPFARANPQIYPFLARCLVQFTNHEYGEVSSLTQVDNLFQRDFSGKSTWLSALYAWRAGGCKVYLELYEDRGVFHLDGDFPHALERSQRALRRDANT